MEPTAKFSLGSLKPLTFPNSEVTTPDDRDLNPRVRPGFQFKKRNRCNSNDEKFRKTERS